MLPFLIAEALRDLRRIGRVGVSAMLLIALSLTALGGFWLLSINLGRAVTQWRERVRIVVYLKDELPIMRVEEIQKQIGSMPGVQRVRYVSKGDALQALKRSLGGQADVVEQLPRNPLPASVEVTPDAETATPDGTRALVGRLAALPGVDEVQGGAQWVEGLAQFQRMFRLIGLSVGAVLAAAAILTVTTATTLVLHLRRDEMEIMRLVGASDTVIRFPRIFQGMTQGLLAAILALAVLEAIYGLAVLRLEPLLPLTLGLQRATFLSIPQMVGLLAAGTLLGGIGGALAGGRARP